MASPVPSTSPSPSPSLDSSSSKEKKSKRKSSKEGKDRTNPLPKVSSETPDGVPKTKERKKTKTAVEKNLLTPKKAGKGPLPRGAHHGSNRGQMKFGDRPSVINDPIQSESDHPPVDSGGHFDLSKYQKMTAVLFHKHNDLSRSARGVGYTPDQAVSKYGPGVTDEAEGLYGPCKLLTDFQYSTWTKTVVPLRNHNVVQGFNEMILYLIRLAAVPDGPANHEEAFMATSFLANIRNDLGEHPPNVLALLEYIDYKTVDDGAEPAAPDIEVVSPCQAADLY